jgi:hypothetical protein
VAFVVNFEKMRNNKCLQQFGGVIVLKTFFSPCNGRIYMIYFVTLPVSGNYKNKFCDHPSWGRASKIA